MIYKLLKTFASISVVRFIACWVILWVFKTLPWVQPIILSSRNFRLVVHCPSKTPRIIFLIINTTPQEVLILTQFLLQPILPLYSSKVLSQTPNLKFRIYQLKDLKNNALNRFNNPNHKHRRNKKSRNFNYPPTKPKYRYHKASMTTKSSNSSEKELLAMFIL